MLLMPPRHGKSELASRMFPAWHLGHQPDHEIIACSYNVSLAMTFSKKVKEVLEDPSYQNVFTTRLHPDNRSAEEWTVHQRRGGYVAAGVGGGITGKGAHILIIDDPIKNAEEADSADVREKLWDWYGSTAYTRLAPGGGVLVIQCMTGDTPVMMEDKTERRLDTLAPGDAIATYASGVLATSRVKAIRSNGRDSILKITTSSGKIVRANQRHPFLTVLPDGGVTWTRAKNLTTAHKIVALKGSGVNGRELPALRKGVKNLPNVADYAQATTTSKSGQPDTDHQASTLSHAETLTSSTATGSHPKTTTSCSKSSGGYALSAACLLPEPPSTGKANSPSITATTAARSVDCFATTATQASDTLPMSQWHLPPRGISDFTLDEVVSIELDGVEEVFDLQVEHTENFIANGLVSHNTWWHDDDLAGRLQTAMKDPESDQFEVVKYPAIAEDDEYLDLVTDRIVGSDAVDALDVPEKIALKLNDACRTLRKLRSRGDALHPQRYDVAKLKRIKATIQPRHWSALYQQNPVPDEGAYFTKDIFRTGALPAAKHCNIFQAWDFAITEKKQNDYTVGSCGYQDTTDTLYVAEMLRFKSNDTYFIVETMIDFYVRHSEMNRNVILGVEDGQIWKAMHSVFKKRCEERNVYPSIVTLTPISDKMARARPLQGRMQQGKVSFDEAAQWYQTVRTEMLRFPAGVNDDCVDSLAWMVQMVLGATPPQPPKQKDQKSWRDKLPGLTRGSNVGHMAA